MLGLAQGQAVRGLTGKGIRAGVQRPKPFQMADVTRYFESNGGGVEV